MVGIKKLLDSFKAPVELDLDMGMGILILKEKKVNRFFFLDNPNEEEIQKFKTLEDVSDIRFLGSTPIYNKLLEADLGWPHFDKIQFITKTSKVHFFPDNQSIRVEKSEIEKTTVKKVLIVDDSATIQKMLGKVIDEDPYSEVVGIARSPSEAKIFIEKERPDVITLDIHMPEMNGVEFYKSYVKALGIPTVLISSVSPSEGPLVLEGLSEGVFTYIKKPTIENFKEVKENIKRQIQLACEVDNKVDETYEFKSLNTLISFDHFNGVIVIGSSTGGTQALEKIFTNLPQSIPPIVVVQHIPAVFSKALAERINTLTPFTVKEAGDGEFIARDTVYIAPGGKQLKLLKRGQERVLKLTDDAPVNRFKPSVDYMFNSVSKHDCSDVVGVILTGMGRDGAKGLLGLKEAGAMTIAQDKESSVVYGMPKEAIEIGAAKKVCSLSDMPAQFVHYFNQIIKKGAA